jgi:glycosyltransferase involved in cell wall biosynthesis
MEKILTVVIPTYNRVKHLIKNLPALLNQLTDECELIIIDNCSNVSVNIEIEQFIKDYPAVKFNIIRNPKNIGLFGNIMKCFEVATTKWLYILGDDDSLMPDSITLILRDIKEHSDCFNLTYKWHPEKKWSQTRPKTTSSFTDYVNSIESIHHVLFLSSNVYNLEKLSINIHTGHYYQITSAPHLVLLLVALDFNKNSNVYLSNNFLVNNLNNEVEDETKWNRFDFFRNNKTILDLPLNPANKRELFLLYKASYPVTTYLNFYLNINNKKILNRINEFKIATYYYRIYGTINDNLLIFISILLLKRPNITLKIINYFRKN